MRQGTLAQGVTPLLGVAVAVTLSVVVVKTGSPLLES